MLLTSKSPSSKFDRLITALCQEHHDSLRQAREEGLVTNRLTVGSRLSGEMTCEREFWEQSSLSLGQSWNSGRQPAARRRVPTIDSSDLSAQASSQLDPLANTALAGPSRERKALVDACDACDSSFGVVQSEEQACLPSLAIAAAASLYDSEQSLENSRVPSWMSRGRQFDLRQAWKAQEWDVRPSQHSVYSKAKSSNVSSEGESDGRRYRSFGDACVLHPNSRKRLSWNMMCFVFIIYDIIFVPLQVFSLEDVEILQVVDWGIRLIWTLDMPVSCFAGFYFKGRLHMSFQATRYRYMTTWFPFDLVLVSCDWLLYFLTAESSYGKILRFARIARLLRLLRLVKLRGLLLVIEDIINTENMAIYFRCLKPLFAVVLLTHVLACGWYGIGMWEDDYEYSWVVTAHLSERTRGYQYATSLHWSLAQFTLNTMDVYARNLGERLYTIAVGLFGIVGFSVLVSGFTSAAEQLREIKSDETKQFWLLRRFIRDHAISNKLAFRVMRYCEYAYLDQKTRTQPEDVGLMKLLSEQLRLELGMEMHLPQLVPHPLFLKMQQLRYRSLRNICFGLSPRSYARGDSFVVKGEDSAGMIMITEGETSYEYTKRECKNCQRLEHDQWLCEPAIWTYWTAVGNAKAVVHSRVLLVFADMMERVFSVAPASEWMYVQRHAQKFVEMLNSYPRDALTDIIDPISLSEGTIDSLPENDMRSVRVFVKHLGRRLSLSKPRLSWASAETSSDKQDDRARRVSWRDMKGEDLQRDTAASPGVNSSELHSSVKSDKSAHFDFRPAIDCYITESDTTCEPFDRSTDFQQKFGRIHL